MQESLTNIAKHAGAQRVSMLLVRRPGVVSALVEDDGHGFTDEDEREGGIGLSGMRERLALLDGRLTIESGRGTGHEPRRRGAALVIRIVVVDDHAVVRSGLRLLLGAEEDMEVVGDAGNVREAVFEVRAAKPDVVLLDVTMPGESGIDGAAEAAARSRRRARVLMLSMQDDPSYVREAFAAGARGYVLKEAIDAEVVAAVREVAAGNRYVHPALGARMVAADAAATGRRRRRPSFRPRARSAEAARARAHEPGDREAALHLGAHGRDAPIAHHAEAAALDPGRARSLRDRARPARDRVVGLRGRSLRAKLSRPSGPVRSGLTKIGASSRSSSTTDRSPTTSSPASRATRILRIASYGIESDTSMPVRVLATCEPHGLAP